MHAQGLTYSGFEDDDDDAVITTGPFADLMRPHEMQPIYLLPLTNGVKQLVTFFVFGFDFKTKFKTGSAKKKMFSFVVSFIAKLAFIFLAVNSYISDLKKFQSRQKHDLDNLWQSCLIALAIWCTSHNFSASLGLWGSFIIQSPAVIFEEDIEDTRYVSVPNWLGRLGSGKDIEFLGSQVLCFFLCPVAGLLFSMTSRRKNKEKKPKQ